MSTCARCGIDIGTRRSGGNPRKWCSDRCKQAVRRIAMGQAPRPPLGVHVGDTFGRLTVVEIVVCYRYGDGRKFARCVCSCGGAIECLASSLTRTKRGTSKGTRSCGCLRVEKSREIGLRVQYGRAARIARQQARAEARELFAEYAARIASAQAEGREVAA